MNVKKLRESLGMTQGEFWKRVGITQSGGSRYEGERRSLPRPVAILVDLAYGNNRDSERAFRRLRLNR